MTFKLTARAAQAGVVLLPVLPVLPDFPLFSIFPVLSAQSITAEGRVLKPDSMPVMGARVVLHRVGRSLQGPLDSTSTDRRGRFHFAFRSDTTALYLLSARHAGIEYFSPPVHTNPDLPDTAIRIVVYDTSGAVPITLEGRNLVVTRPGEDGSRSVLDLLVLRNDGRLTRVSPDSLRPSWSGPLPRGTLGLQLGEGDISPDAVSRRNDSLIVTAPLAPGEKRITVEYLMPSDHEVLELRFPEPVSAANVLVEEKDARVSGGTLALADTQVIEGRSLLRWIGAVPAGDVVRVTLPGVRQASRWLLTALVGLIVVGLGWGGWYVLHSRAVGSAMISPGELIDAIATLDARYLGRQGETPTQEWNFYRAERARLKAQLEASLAAGRRSP